MSAPRGDPDFHTTRWSQVLEAGQETGRAALGALLDAYWYPLYALGRRSGLAPPDAEDAVQGFLAALLSRGDVARADPARGRFRAWLGTAFRNHLSNLRDAARAQKRGGGREPIALDLSQAEERYVQGSGRALQPEQLFDRAWALTLLERALAALREDYAARGKTDLFEALRPTLMTEEPAPDRAQLAARLGLSEGALKVASHRLRRRYRETLLAAVADTLSDPNEIQDELQALFAALGG